MRYTTRIWYETPKRDHILAAKLTGPDMEASNQSVHRFFETHVGNTNISLCTMFLLSNPRGEPPDLRLKYATDA